MRSKDPIRPRALGTGSQVALIAPAGPLLERDDVARAEELSRALGWTPVTGRHVDDLHHYFAGNDAARLADLNEALASEAVDAVWCIRGGFGLTRLIQDVDFSGFGRQPKIVLGFSDVTALLLALYQHTGVVTFHGPVARRGLSPFSRRALEQVVTSTEPAGALEELRPGGDVLVPGQHRIVTIRGGSAEGRLIGGNLSLLQCLVGTPHLPSLDGAILFLEDVGEAVYRIDRMLSHLRLAGLLDGLAGVALGQFTEVRDRSTDGAVGLDRIIQEYLEPLKIPVALGLPIGHVDDQWTIPIGVQARFDADAGSLTLLDAAVS